MSCEGKGSEIEREVKEDLHAQPPCGRLLEGSKKAPSFQTIPDHRGPSPFLPAANPFSSHAQNSARKENSQPCGRPGTVQSFGGVVNFNNVDQLGRSGGDDNNIEDPCRPCGLNTDQPKV